MNTKTSAYPKRVRLTEAAEFRRVFKTGKRTGNRYFTIVTNVNRLNAARLGMAVSRKNAGNAVKRNRLKRLIRESFRSQAGNLPAVDIVVMTRPAAKEAQASEIRASLDKLWQRIS